MNYEKIKMPETLTVNQTAEAINIPKHRDVFMNYEMFEKPVMLTVNQTAETFGIARHHARQLALTGKVKAIRCGVKILINAASVAEFFNTSTLNDVEQTEYIKPIPAKIGGYKI